MFKPPLFLAILRLQTLDSQGQCVGAHLRGGSLLRRLLGGSPIPLEPKHVLMVISWIGEVGLQWRWLCREQRNNMTNQMLETKSLSKLDRCSQPYNHALLMFAHVVL